MILVACYQNTPELFFSSLCGLFSSVCFMNHVRIFPLSQLIFHLLGVMTEGMLRIISSTIRRIVDAVEITYD